MNEIQREAILSLMRSTVQHFSDNAYGRAVEVNDVDAAILRLNELEVVKDEELISAVASSAGSDPLYARQMLSGIAGIMNVR